MSICEEINTAANIQFPLTKGSSRHASEKQIVETFQYSGGEEDSLQLCAWPLRLAPTAASNAACSSDVALNENYF